VNQKRLEDFRRDKNDFREDIQRDQINRAAAKDQFKPVFLR
jgi:hypothetical protein